MKKADWLYGRNIVLTGCTSGIGQQLLLDLVNTYGCNVMGVARNIKKLDKLKEQLGDKFSYRTFDIGSLEAWRNFASELEENGFMTDVLINNAGMIQPFAQYNDLTDEQIDTVISTNLRSVEFGCRAMIPTIKKSMFGGIANVASASAILPVGGEGIYSVTKAGVWALSLCLYQELRGFGVFVSCIMPGPVKTDIYKARKCDGQTKNKADSFIANLGASPLKVSYRILQAVRKKKMRVMPDSVSRLMDFVMRICPITVTKFTGWAVKKVSKKEPSFKPIYQEQYDNAKEISDKIEQRKDFIYKDKSEVPPQELFKQLEEKKLLGSVQ